MQAARISGSAFDSKGRALSGTFINLTQAIGAMPVGSSGSVVRPDRTFTIGGVTPGDYVLRTLNAPDGESAAVRVSMNGGDVSDVQVAAASPSVLRGRSVFEPGATPFKASGVHLNAIRSNPLLGGANVTVNDDLTFEIKVSAGHFLIRTPNPGPQWRLNRVVAGGVASRAGRELESSGLVSASVTP